MVAKSLLLLKSKLHDGTSDDEKADLIFKTNDGSDGASPTERMRVDSDGNIGVGINALSSMLHLFDGEQILVLLYSQKFKQVRHHQLHLCLVTQVM